MLGRLRRFKSEPDGAATVEFVIIFPVLIAIVFAAIESGFLMTRYMILDRAMDLTVRDLRLGVFPDGTTHDQIRFRVCQYARILENCNTTMELEIREADDPTLAATFPANDANCIDTSGVVAPALATTVGERGQLMYMRVCALVTPIMPGIGMGLLLPKDGNDFHRMITYTAFMNEPS